MAKEDPILDPDDMFADTRMSFGDHIEDLRVHLWRGIKWFIFGIIIGFVVGKQVLAFITQPVQEALEEFADRRSAEVQEEIEKGEADSVKANKTTEWERIEFSRKQLALLVQGEFSQVDKFPKPDDDIDAADTVEVWFRYRNPVDVAIAMRKAQTRIGKRPGLTTLNVQEAFMVYLQVALVTGFVIGSPGIFYNLWLFVAAGLYPHEKKYVHVYVPFSLGLFLLGVLLCEFLVMPKAVEALLWFNEWLGLEPDLRLNEWLGFAIWMPVIFGISFQTPLVMLFMYKIGFASIETFTGKRRIIWFLMAVFAAVITPSTDPYSMIFLWIPMCLLFELGIMLCRLYPPPPPEPDEEESEEVVEV